MVYKLNVCESKYTKAIREGVNAPASTLFDLDTILDYQFKTKAMIVPALVFKSGQIADIQYRISNESVDYLETNGFEIKTNIFFADIDLPKLNGSKGCWTEDTFNTFITAWNSRSDALSTCGYYLSEHGIRIVQPLDNYYLCTKITPYLLQWRHDFDKSSGLWPIDSQTKDWTRLQKVPNFTDEGKQYNHRSFWKTNQSDFSRLAPIKLPTLTNTDIINIATNTTNNSGTNSNNSNNSNTKSYGILTKKPLPTEYEALASKLNSAIDTFSDDFEKNGDTRTCYFAIAGFLSTRMPPEFIHALVYAAIPNRFKHIRGYVADRLRIVSDVLSHGGNKQGLPTLNKVFEYKPIHRVLSDAFVNSNYTRAEKAIDISIEKRPQENSLDEAQIKLSNFISSAGPTDILLIQAPPGFGKTQFFVEAAKSGESVSIASPTHMLAQQTATNIGEAVYMYSPFSQKDSEGKYICPFAESARSLADGGLKTKQLFCRGNNNPKYKCPNFDFCEVKDGTSGNGISFVSVHSLTKKLRKSTPDDSWLVIDEPGELASLTKITLADIKRFTDVKIRSYFANKNGETPFSLLFALAASKSLLSWKGTVPVSLLDALEQSCHTVGLTINQFEEALCYLDEDLEVNTSKVTEIRCNPYLARLIGFASKMVNAFRDGIKHCHKIKYYSNHGVTTPTDTECGLQILHLNSNLENALEHPGKIAILDANMYVHESAIIEYCRNKYPSRPVKKLEIEVRDSVKIQKIIIAKNYANVRNFVKEARWTGDKSIHVALSSALVEAKRRGCKKIGIITFKRVREALEIAKCTDAARSIEKASELIPGANALKPLISGFNVVFNHFGNIRGDNSMKDCDCIITLGDPRPNIGEVIDKCGFVGSDPNAMANQWAAAELQQAHGRLRTIHRTKPGVQIHVGSIAPRGFWSDETLVLNQNGRPESLNTNPLKEEFDRLTKGMTAKQVSEKIKKSVGTVNGYRTGARNISEEIINLLK